jgi:hypothetical protein
MVEGKAMLSFIVPGKTEASAKRVFVLRTNGEAREGQAQDAATMTESKDEERMTLSWNETALLRYQITPMTAPIGGERFAASAFIDPLKTPAGFTVTQAQPGDHRHHLGLWWPWRYVEVDGRRFNSWELQHGQGYVYGRSIAEQSAGDVFAGFTTQSDVVDRTGEDGDRVVINEQTRVRMWRPGEQPAKGYYLDIVIDHTPAIDEPVDIVQYHYSGFCLRGTHVWDRTNSTILTSHGRQRDNSDNTRARWVHVQGKIEDNAAAGVVMMSHPDNPDHPEKLRTWNATQHNGSVFVNFNPVRDGTLRIEPGQTLTRRYRLFIYDGELPGEVAEQLWNDYAKPAKVEVQAK